LLVNLASGPQIAVTKTATHMAVIDSDAHISGIRGTDDHRDGSRTAGDGPCDMVDIVYTPFLKTILGQASPGVIRVSPGRGSVDRSPRIVRSMGPSGHMRADGRAALSTSRA
jgi:hypothetical protein